MKLLATLRTTDIEAACRPVNEKRDALSAVCRQIRQSLGTISDLLSQTYFNHALESGPPDLAAEAAGGRFAPGAQGTGVPGGGTV
jgi:hypothetical protein